MFLMKYYVGVSIIIIIKKMCADKSFTINIATFCKKLRDVIFDFMVTSSLFKKV